MRLDTRGLLPAIALVGLGIAFVLAGRWVAREVELVGEAQEL